MNNNDPSKTDSPACVDAALQAVCNCLQRRGFLTTEWWTTVAAAGLTSVLAKIGVPGPTTVQIVSVLAPLLVAVVYAIARTAHKSALGTAIITNFLRN